MGGSGKAKTGRQRYRSVCALDAVLPVGSADAFRVGEAVAEAANNRNSDNQNVPSAGQDQ
jgi:hypothetical protein